MAPFGEMVALAPPALRSTVPSLSIETAELESCPWKEALAEIEMSRTPAGISAELLVLTVGAPKYGDDPITAPVLGVEDALGGLCLVGAVLTQP